MELKPGDIFVSENPSPFLKYFIMKAQRAIAFDGHAVYGHAGIIVDSGGRTFESGIKIKGLNGFRIGYQNLYEEYDGVNVMILRHAEMTENVFEPAFSPLSTEYCKKIYPIWRLPLFLIPSVARKIKMTNLGVCSEIAAKLLYNAGLIPQWRSVFPDMLADWGHQTWGKKGLNIIWKGIISIDQEIRA